LLVGCIFAAPVHAQNNRSFISGTGSVQGHGWGELTAPLSANAVVTINAPGDDDIILDGLSSRASAVVQWAFYFSRGSSLNVQNCRR
jgi:hypothetical protein